MASKERSTFNRRPLTSREIQMERRALEQAVLRMQAHYIRTTLAGEIEDFEDSFEDILETASVFLAATEQIIHSPSLVIIDQESVVKTVCRFLATSNIILEFLDFQHRKTGLVGGGDVSLENQVKAAQAIVQELLQAFLFHKEAESYPGKEMGMIYNEDVKVFGGYVFHKHNHVEYGDAPDPAGDEDDLQKLMSYWHAEHIYHPLRHVPGTHWHKFFGNIQPGPIFPPELFRDRGPLPFFTTIIPKSIAWLQPELIADYDAKRLLFERTGRLPGPRRPEYIRVSMIKKVQRDLSCLFRGWKRYEDEKILCSEDMSVVPCPEYDILGFSRFEALNAEINAPELAGLALLGEDLLEVPVFLTGEPRRYWRVFDGQWE